MPDTDIEMDLPTSQKMTAAEMSAWAAGGRGFWEVTKAAARLFSRRSGALLAGAVAFFSLLSIVPILFIAVSVAKLGAREESARLGLIAELGRWIGAGGAATVGDLLARTGAGGSIATRVLHTAVLVYMSTRLFSQLRRSINHLWHVELLPVKGVRDTLIKKAQRLVTAFVMVVVIDVILLAMVGVKTALGLMIGRVTPALHAPYLWYGLEVSISFAVVTLLFATMFRMLPDARIAWRDLWVGALVTALLFSAGATLVSFYLGHKTVEAEFGDGGAVVMLLLWVNYSAQIFFFGVSFTGVWAERNGSGIRPVNGAQRLPMMV